MLNEAWGGPTRRSPVQPSDFTGHRHARAALAAVGTASAGSQPGESAHKVYSDQSIEQITSENYLHRQRPAMSLAPSGHSR